MTLPPALRRIGPALVIAIGIAVVVAACIPGAGTVFEPHHKLTFLGIVDGASNTIWCAEAPDPVKWPEPNDITAQRRS